ncbi:hypothetical protein BJQ89_01130 [Arthrobacter sp. ES1]|nr:hypothetical protein [Arthrobacter sp. ES1]
MSSLNPVWEWLASHMPSSEVTGFGAKDTRSKPVCSRAASAGAPTKLRLGNRPRAEYASACRVLIPGVVTESSLCCADHAQRAPIYFCTNASTVLP